MKQIIKNKNYKKRLQSAGFTLIELITVIIILSVISVGISSFIGIASQTFVNVTERDEIVASARFSLERLNRELREALPNSVRRLTFTGGTTCVEFVPVIGSTSYLNADLTNSIDAIDVITFKVKDNAGKIVDYSCDSCGHSIVIYPQGQTVDGTGISDVYVDPNQTSGQLFAIDDYTLDSGDIWQISLANSVTVTNPSPTQRLFIVNQPIRYCLASNELNRISGYTFNTADIENEVLPTGGIETLMAEGVTGDFTVVNATLVRNSMVQIALTFSRENDTERVVFNHEVHIANTP